MKYRIEITVDGWETGAGWSYSEGLANFEQETLPSDNQIVSIVENLVDEDSFNPADFEDGTFEGASDLRYTVSAKPVDENGEAIEGPSIEKFYWASDIFKTLYLEA